MKAARLTVLPSPRKDLNKSRTYARSLIRTSNTVFIRLVMRDAARTMIDASDKSVIPRVSTRPTHFTPRSLGEAIDPNIPRSPSPTSCIENGDVTPCIWLRIPKISWVITGGHACLRSHRATSRAGTSSINTIYPLSRRDTFESWGLPDCPRFFLDSFDELRCEIPVIDSGN